MNGLYVGGTPPVAPSPVAPVVPHVAPAVHAVPTLAFTGVDFIELVIVGVILVALGALLLWHRRRPS